MVRGTLRCGCSIFFLRLPGFAVERPADFTLAPLDAKGVESVGERAASELGFVAGGTVVWPLAAVVQRAEQLVRLAPLSSTMSISPLAAHEPYFSSVGSIQMAGQMPLPVGKLGANLDFP